MATWDQGIWAVRWMKRYLRSVEARDMSLSLACRKRVMPAWSGADTVDKSGRGTSALTFSGWRGRVSIYQWVITAGSLANDKDMMGFQELEVNYLLDGGLQQFVDRLIL